MVQVKNKQIEIHEGRRNEVIIKQLIIDESKSSIKMTYRKDSEGNTIVTGFNVKTYGETTRKIKSKNDSLIRYGIERMNNPMMKGDK